MKVRTTVIVTVERADGSGVTLDRTIVSNHGDNPAFERGEVKGALAVAHKEFVEANNLDDRRAL